jgi:hypothetical protein
MLTAIAENDHAGELAAGSGASGLGNGCSNRRLIRGLSGLPCGERKQITVSRCHGPKFAIEDVGRDVEITTLHQRIGRWSRGLERRGQLIPAGSAVGTVRHSHALRGVGQHHYRALLPRLPRRDERRPQHAEHESQKPAKSQQHERQQAPPGHAGAIGRHGQQDGHERDRDQGNEEP